MPSLPVIVFIPCSGVGCKPDEYDVEWLPRECPFCGAAAIIGHGRRDRQAHDRLHVWIRVRRGLCKLCDHTLTALPGWCVPRAHYSLSARRQTEARLASGDSLEQAVPECLDPDRVADPSTLRRWVGRRIESLCICAAPRWAAFFLHSPTILAWDFRAAARILIVEASPP